jgi:DNA-binding transcriptional ArsR family regulator
MARTATTADVFNAIAEERRRAIVELLAEGGEQPVGVIVSSMGMAQPAVSKHLGVLREVGVVSVRRRGRERVYSLNPDSLRTVHEWASMFERFWSHKADRIKERAERAAARGTEGTG